MTKQVHIIGGGTVAYIRPHLAIAAPAYGTTAHALSVELQSRPDFRGDVFLYTTRMAGEYFEKYTISDDGRPTWEVPDKGLLDELGNAPRLETNEDLALLIDRLVADPAPKILFLPVSVCDFEPTRITVDGLDWDSGRAVGKHLDRLSTSAHENISIGLRMAEKIIKRVRKTRKDIFLVGFKETTGSTPQEQFVAGLHLLKQSSCNLVLANDTKTRMNVIVTPEEAPYGPYSNRDMALSLLLSMAITRSNGHFTRSHVVEAEYVPWDSYLIPDSLRAVVDYCIKRGAYKPFMGRTVGHFAIRKGENTFLTSMRGKNFNDLGQPNSGVGLVEVQAVSDNEVLAYGGKPSVGGQSQRIIFRNHPDVDCIVHFHCPMKKGQRPIPVRSQAIHECGSHECGQNTSDGLLPFELADGKRKETVKAVMLDHHGPNIVFHRDTNPKTVIDFIEAHWDLDRSTSEISD